MKYFLIAIFAFALTSCLTDEQQEEMALASDSPVVEENGVDTFIVGGKGTLADIESAKGESLKSGNDSALQNIRYEIAGSNQENENGLSVTGTIERNPDVGPSFPGGSNAMDKYIAEKLVYPLVAFQNEIQGTVNVKFVVERDGSLSGITVVKGLGYGCDESAIDLIKGMPKWTPGKKGGVSVRCSVVLPIAFGKRGQY